MPIRTVNGAPDGRHWSASSSNYKLEGKIPMGIMLVNKLRDSVKKVSDHIDFESELSQPAAADLDQAGLKDLTGLDAPVSGVLEQNIFYVNQIMKFGKFFAVFQNDPADAGKTVVTAYMALAVETSVLDKQKEFENVPVLRNLVPAQVLMGQSSFNSGQVDQRRIAQIRTQRDQDGRRAFGARQVADKRSSGRARLIAAFERLHHFVDRLHVGELAVEPRQRGVVFLVGTGGETVGHHDGLEIEHHRITRGALAADMGGGAGDQDGVDIALAQMPLDVGGALDESAVALLRQASVFGPDVVKVPEFETVVAFLHGFVAAPHALRRQQTFVVGRPALARIGRCRCESRRRGRRGGAARQRDD